MESHFHCLQRRWKKIKETQFRYIVYNVIVFLLFFEEGEKNKQRKHNFIVYYTKNCIFVVSKGSAKKWKLNFVIHYTRELNFYLPLLLSLCFTSSNLNHNHVTHCHHCATQTTPTPTDLCATTPSHNGEIAQAEPWRFSLAHKWRWNDGVASAMLVATPRGSCTQIQSLE